jgi:hypothetical protein
MRHAREADESQKNVGLGDSGFRVLEALLHKGRCQSAPSVRKWN